MTRVASGTLRASTDQEHGEKNTISSLQKEMQALQQQLGNMYALLQWYQNVYEY